MCPLTDLPLFSGVPAAEPPPKRKRRRERRTLIAELVPDYIEPPASSMNGAMLLPFPPSRDTKLIVDLARAFVVLRDRHGRQCRVMLLDKRFRPIATKLRRMGVAPSEVQAELARVEKAVARVVWIQDGRPNYGSGGGSAA